MFLLYHSEGCNICEMVLHECYVNDLHTTTCSGMLGQHKKEAKDTNLHEVKERIRLARWTMKYEERTQGILLHRPG
jgi:hypothetical protein